MLYELLKLKFRDCEEDVLIKKYLITMERCSGTTLSGSQCKLPVKENGRCSKHTGDVCSICLASMTRTNSKKLDNCIHDFHTKCIDKWRKKHNSCPVCRKPIDDIQYTVSIRIEPGNLRSNIVTNNVASISTLFGVEHNLENFLTEIQFSSSVEDDIRHILQEIGFPVTTFPARTQ
jgi:hypothetical protein